MGVSLNPKTQDKKLILSLDLMLEYPKRDFLISLESLRDCSEWQLYKVLLLLLSCRRLIILIDKVQGNQVRRMVHGGSRVSGNCARITTVLRSRYRLR